MVTPPDEHPAAPGEAFGTLPEPPRPQGDYVPTSRAGNLVLSAGMTPRVDGVLVVTGQVGGETDVAEARRGAAIAARNALAAVAAEAGGLDAVAGLVRMTVFVNAAPAFTEHTAVADAATQALVSILGKRGRCARSAVGVASLPGGASVEIELTARLA